MRALDQGIKKLQDLMARIQLTTDAEQREALLHEHMIAMLEQMKLIRKQASGMKMAMMGGGMGMMGGEQKREGAAPGEQGGESGMMGGMMRGGMMRGGMMKMHQMMEKRIELLELMLEQAIEHAHAREAAAH